MDPAAAAVLVLANGQWLWSAAVASATPGLALTTIESIFIASLAVAACAALLWIVQALDGMRRASTDSSIAVSNSVSALLLVALVCGTVAIRPAARPEQSR